ncbi:MAG: hypothetical protein QF718_00335 [Phycisphaerales bacterium]|jgi:tRNA A37 threonylcarbamoyladenosine modification protein TsaB|nr:hypothetical protein [Phycisphaerales bacterium]
MNSKLSTYPTTISLELSQQFGSVAMMNGTGETKVERVHVNNQEVDEVLPTIDMVSKKLEIVPQNIELVVVSIGPGGFTGLRTSTAISKMIALASGAKIVPVESAISIANQSNVGDGPFFVISSVKDDSFWLSLVTKIDGEWVCKSKNTSTQSISENIGNIHTVFADEYLPEETKIMIEQHGVPILPSKTDALTLLRIGVGLYKEGKTIDPTVLLPMYPRVPEAVRVWKTRHPNNP